MPQVLNNLAWLYATCEDARYRNAGRALLLAQKASSLKPSPEVFDTLAESYHVNGNNKKAIDAETMALSMADKNRRYYEAQLKKFRIRKNGTE